MVKRSAWKIFGFDSNCAYQQYLLENFKRDFPEKVKYLKLKNKKCN